MKRHVWIAGSLFTIMILSAASMVWAPPKGDVWLMKHTPMPSQRVGFATSAVNGKIYLIGDTVWDKWPRVGRVLSTVEEYDPVTNQWKRRANMRIGRTLLATSAVNGKIYAIGGSVQVWWDRKHLRRIQSCNGHLGDEGGYA